MVEQRRDLVGVEFGSVLCGLLRRRLVVRFRRLLAGVFFQQLRDLIGLVVGRLGFDRFVSRLRIGLRLGRGGLGLDFLLADLVGGLVDRLRHIDLVGDRKSV